MPTIDQLRHTLRLARDRVRVTPEIIAYVEAMNALRNQEVDEIVATSQEQIEKLIALHHKSFWKGFWVASTLFILAAPLAGLMLVLLLHR